ncbi:MAG: energy transducer TonB [Bacteroidetes bacterium]|nr:MAG: energy transducer TonB [Bacteroidota bacterium]
MELRKYPEVDVRRKADIFFMIGLIASLGLTLGAFSITTHDEVEQQEQAELIDDEPEEVMDITRQEQPPPPPPPPPQTIEVIEDDSEVEEAEIESTETNQDDEIIEYVPEQVEVAEATKEPEVFTVVEDMPEFPGGQGELFKYLQKNLEYPPLAKENNIQGRVVIEFVIDENGRITSPRVVKDIGWGCGEAALKVVKSMPRWKPGKQRNKPVSVRYNLPVRFQLD